MPRPPLARTRRRLVARIASAVLPFLVACAAVAPAGAAVSPYPPIPLGSVTVGATLEATVTVPITMSIADIPAAYDSQVLFTAADLLQAAALELLGLTSPVTVGQLKAVTPTLGLTIAPPTATLDDPSGYYSLEDLGCTATQCRYRASFTPGAPGTFDAQLAVAIPSFTFVNGGLLGEFANALAAFLLPLVNNALVYDFTARGVTRALPGSGGTVAVPGPTGLALAGLAFALAVAGAAAIARRRAARG